MTGKPFCRHFTAAAAFEAFPGLSSYANNALNLRKAYFASLCQLRRSCASRPWSADHRMPGKQWHGMCIRPNDVMFGADRHVYGLTSSILSWYSHQHTIPKCQLTTPPMRLGRQAPTQNLPLVHSLRHTTSLRCRQAPGTCDRRHSSANQHVQQPVNNIRRMAKPSLPLFHVSEQVVNVVPCTTVLVASRWSNLQRPLSGMLRSFAPGYLAPYQGR